MIPPLDAFLQGLTYFAQARRLSPVRDEPRIAEALRLAAELARDRPEDEPAAMIFALSRRVRTLGAAWEEYPLLCARNLASALPAELDAWPGDAELENLRLRIAWGQASYEDARALVATRLRRG